MAGEIRDHLWKGFPIVNVRNALFLNRAIG